MLPLVVPALFAALAAAETLWPARPLPRVPGWRRTGLLFFAMTGVLAALLPFVYVGFARAHRLVDLEGLGPIGGAAVAWLAVELVGYAWHRLRHRPLLWPIHRLHHSAVRLDVFGASYFHPLDVGSNLVLGGLVSTMLVGVTPAAATLASLAATFCSFFQHTNVRTPRWLGYLVQRPEAHSVHHARGRHGGNYANLPVIDMLFGTFVNPERFEPEQGL